MIQTHHRWKHTTIPLSLDSSDVVGIVAKLSKLSETLKDKKICCSYRNNERLVFHQIEVTDPVKKNDFYSGSQQENPLPELGSSQLPLFTGVKASKATSAKKPIEDKEAAAKFQAMCSIKEKDIALKEKDLALKEKVSKMSLLDSLISKQEPLSEKEEALKAKLLTEMLDN
ncbi:hypothetical protein F2Q69_00037498 [Brassica cretica]|uniref:Uncharacterized protein n=1 Tax=Brassica cretica TaxID=69181 RepID=A0A8S9STE8_BRACR|nr:hypothetical protein F2Q69_00037498 [Brassica cretica]